MRQGPLIWLVTLIVNKFCNFILSASLIISFYLESYGIFLEGGCLGWGGCLGLGWMDGGMFMKDILTQYITINFVFVKNLFT